MTRARDWLGTRSPAPPERLMVRMLDALADSGEGVELCVQFGDAALGCLRDALAGQARDSAALDLLAADGLLTYAWEAAAEEGAAGLERFAAAYSPDRIARLLPEGA